MKKGKDVKHTHVVVAVKPVRAVQQHPLLLTASLKSAEKMFHGLKGKFERFVFHAAVLASALNIWMTVR